MFETCIIYVGMVKIDKECFYAMARYTNNIMWLLFVNRRYETIIQYCKVIYK